MREKNWKKSKNSNVSRGCREPMKSSTLTKKYIYVEMGWLEWISANIVKTARVYWRAPVLLYGGRDTRVPESPGIPRQFCCAFIWKHCGKITRVTESLLSQSWQIQELSWPDKWYDYHFCWTPRFFFFKSFYRITFCAGRHNEATINHSACSQWRGTELKVFIWSFFAQLG